jgi:hypothetical protein
MALSFMKHDMFTGITAVAYTNYHKLLLSSCIANAQKVKSRSVNQLGLQSWNVTLSDAQGIKIIFHILFSFISLTQTIIHYYSAVVL